MVLDKNVQIFWFKILKNVNLKSKVLTCTIALRWILNTKLILQRYISDWVVSGLRIENLRQTNWLNAYNCHTICMVM